MPRTGRDHQPHRGQDPDRRDFLKVSLRAGAALAITAGAAFTLLEREGSSPHQASVLRLDYRRQEDPAHPQLVMAHEQDPVRAVDRAIEALGTMSRFIRPGERVAIKPNIAWERFAEQAATTNPHLVGRLVELCLAAGASQVLVYDATCNDAQRTYQKSGIAEAAYSAGATVLLPEERWFTEVEIGGGILGRWPVFRPLIEADRVINVPILKHHGLTGVTAAIKNWYGLLGGPRNLLHQDIHLSLFDLARFIQPTLTVVDAIRVLVRNGPQGGRYEDVERRDAVIAGTDQVACEALAVTLLGRRAEEFRYLSLCNGVVGQTDIGRVRFLELS
ncbi:MAG: DUF362 domain-containing protein [Bradymonadales bacterium]|nr:DUF362 domain-containing protein [Bradymonadales bacterium]